MNPPLKKAGWYEKLLTLLGRRLITSVEGESMFPILTGGDRVIVDPRADVRTGDIVLADHPFKSSVRILKRVTEITADGRYFLEGDNPVESSDSRSFGSIAASDIRGRVISVV